MRYIKGFKLALITAGFSGVAVFLNSLTVKAVGDALMFTTIKNLGVAIILGIILLRQSAKGRREIDWQQVKANWGKLLLIGIIGGSLPFYLFFKGLMIMNPVTGALIHKTLIFWVALLALPMLKEKISLKQWLALGVIFSSNFLIGGLPVLKFGVGELMILGATFLWAIENIIAKKVLRKLSAEVVAGARMIIGSALLLGAVIMSGKMGLIFNLNSSQWLMTGVSIFMLTGYVLSWYKALKLAPVTLVATVLTLGTVITNGLSVVFITHSLNIELIYQFILLVIFSYIFVKEVDPSIDEARKNDRIINLRAV